MAPNYSDLLASEYISRRTVVHFIVLECGVLIVLLIFAVLSLIGSMQNQDKVNKLSNDIDSLLDKL